MWYSKDDIRIEPGEFYQSNIANMYDGYEGTYSNGEGYTKRFLTDDGYEEYQLSEFTTEDGKVHKVSGLSIYEKLE